MNVAAITGKMQGSLVEKPDPRAKDDLVVVKVNVVPMCTEWKMFAAGQCGETLGHEAAGEVVEVARPGKVKVGDRVVVMPIYACGRCALCISGDYIHCQNPINALAASGNTAGTATYAQYLIKPDWMLLPIPEDLSYEHASMTCCGLGPTFGAMQRMAVDAFDTVLITGAGPVGLGGVINAVHRGARVIVSEPVAYRRELARRLGAAETVDPGRPGALDRVRQMTGGWGVDKAVDCSGEADAQRLMIDAVRRRGEVAFVGEGGELKVHVSNDLLRKGIALHGIWHWNLNDAPRILSVIRKQGALIEQLITHRFPMGRAQEAWTLQVAKQCGKVLLDPWK